MAGYIILAIFGILMFFSVLIFLALFIYSFHSEKTKDDRERKCAPYHEAGHVILAMATGMGFEEVSIEDSDNNFGFMSHQKEQYGKTRDENPSKIKDMSPRELMENSLMTSLAGYIAEMLTCGKKSLPSSHLKYGDMKIINDIINDAPYLYTDLHLTSEAYLDLLAVRTRKILECETKAHQVLSEELMDKKILTEEEVWDLMTSRGLCNSFHNPYHSEASSLPV